MFASSVQILVRGLSSSVGVTVPRQSSSLVGVHSQWLPRRTRGGAGSRALSSLSKQRLTVKTGSTQTRHETTTTTPTATTTMTGPGIPRIATVTSSHTGTDTAGDLTRRMTHHSSSLRMPSQAVNVSTISPAAGSGRVVISRVMETKDAQLYSTVHGGTMMNLMEEAGAILSAEYCQANTPGGAEAVTTVSACLEKAEFLQPVFVGQLIEIHAEIGYVSQNSLQVLLNVYVNTGDTEDERRLTNRSKIWYVPQSKSSDTLSSVLPVPPFTDYTSPAVQQRGLVSYEAMKQLRQDLKRKQPAQPVSTWFGIPQTEHRFEPETVDFSRTMMIKGVHPSSCWPGESYCRGGVVLKLIDEVGCLAAVQHCNHFCVTVSVDSTFFFKKIGLGSALVAYSRVIFSSTKAVELKVDVDYQTIDPKLGMIRVRAAESIVTCVGVNEDFETCKMPPLKIITEEERETFEERKRLYEERKKLSTAKRASTNQ